MQQVVDSAIASNVNTIDVYLAGLTSFNSKHTPALVSAYIGHERPLLEYESLMWNPHLVKDIKRIEFVHCRDSSLNGFFVQPIKLVERAN